MNRRTTLVIFVAWSMLAGCGVKGALYLPEKPGKVIIRPAPGTGPTAEPTAPQPESPPVPAPDPPRE